MKVLGMESATEVVTDGHQRSVCFGDSGGPSYIERNQRFYIWGVASAVSNATCTEYAIHTDISSYEAWIQDLAARLTKDAGDLEAKAAAAAAATRQPSALVKADIASH
jgi:secreted trypsin-like serine protease